MINIKNIFNLFRHRKMSDWDQNVFNCELLLKKGERIQKRLFCISACILFYKLYMPYLCLINSKESINILKNGIDFFWKKLNCIEQINCELNKDKLLAILPPSLEARETIKDIELQKKYDSIECLLAIEIGVIFLYSYDFYSTDEDQNLHWVVNATLGATEYFAQLSSPNEANHLLAKQFERNIHLVHFICNNLSPYQILQKQFKSFWEQKINQFSLLSEITGR